ncbi:fosmidomycin resistance protein [Halobellus sp. GM3]|uniref:fosmidomycin resistance protein n=1 Tax=Halobellus sp. GM3 TaxID=3458410 RepID=UPI00403E2277
MLTALRRLGLEVKHLDSARAFYETRLGLVPTVPGAERVGSESELGSDDGRKPARDPVTEDEAGPRVCYAIGSDADGSPATTLVLRRPTGQPRGGVHTHYAFSTTAAAYPRWMQRLSDLDPSEFSFGSSESLYVYDPAGHCVEIGSVDRDSPNAKSGDNDTESRQSGDEGDHSAPPPLSGIFEVVLEVTDLAAAESRYRRLGFEVVDRGETRRRVRLSGPLDLELWEPQLGIADARGGLHVDLAFETPVPDAVVEAGAPWCGDPEPVDGGLRVVDDDGHVLTFLAPVADR